MKVIESNEDNEQNLDKESCIPCTNNCTETYQNKACNAEQILKYSTPDKKCYTRLHSTFNSPLQTLRNKAKRKEYMSTPTGSKQNSLVVASNPFDVEIESLSMSSFSPSVFTVTRKNSQECVSFRWSIEQLAHLEPADIDENTQQDLWLDKDKEIKAQQAIDIFFSKKCIAPSPWTPTIKYMPISPQIASTSSNSQREVRKIFKKQTKSDDNISAREVSTQTALTIPPNVNLMKLLGHFYTYEDEEPDVFNSPLSSNDVDTPGNTSLRRKLFMNEDKTESPFEMKLQIDNMPIACDTPNVKTSRLCPTPSSDHFSSSPITPRNWSLSTNQISMSSPDISPICAVSRKTPLRTRLLEKQERISVEIEKFSSSLKKPTLDPTSLHPNLTLGMISAIEAESTSNETWDMSKQDNQIQQESSEVPAFPNTYTESSSNHPDTGYLTGSINSMITQQTSSLMQYRATPVAELLGDCMISQFQQQQQCEHYNYVQNYNDCCKAFESEDSAMICSQEQSSTNAGFLQSVPWNPPGFSTPTKRSEFL